MNHETFASITGTASVMAFAGFAVGLAYFVTLRRTVILFAAGRSWLWLSALTLGRIGAVTTFLALTARLGAAPLLATFAGFLLSRAVAFRAVRRDG